MILASDVFHSGAAASRRCSSAACCSSAVATTPSRPSARPASVIGGLVLEQRWLATGFDPGSARALGARSALPDIALLALVALVAVAALSTLGALLATALLVVPAATTRLRLLAPAPVAAGHGRARGGRGRRGPVALGEVNTPPGAGHRRARRRGVRRRGRRPRVLGGAPLRRGRGGGGRARAARRRLRRRASAPQRPARLRVVATTTQIGDFARAVGGERARSSRSCGPTPIPHDYEPRPSDVRETADADVVLLNGDELDRLDGRRRRSGGRRPGGRRPRRARARSRSRARATGPRPRATTPTGGTTRATPRRPSAAIRDALDEGQPGRRRTSTRATPPPTWPGCRASTAGSPPA